MHTNALTNENPRNLLISAARLPIQTLSLSGTAFVQRTLDSIESCYKRSHQRISSLSTLKRTPQPSYERSNLVELPSYQRSHQRISSISTLKRTSQPSDPPSHLVELELACTG